MRELYEPDTICVSRQMSAPSLSRWRVRSADLEELKADANAGAGAAPGWGGRPAHRRVSCVVLIAGAVALLQCSAAMAGIGEPVVTITSPSEGAVTASATPTFSGTTTEPSELETSEIAVSVYEGGSTAGKRLARVTSRSFAGSWNLGPVEALAPGYYTAKAEQTNALSGESVASSPVHFTVDTVAPLVGVSSASPGPGGTSETLSGGAGTAGGDLPAVTVRVFASGSPGSQPLESVTVSRSGSSWSASVGGLTPGASYVARAEQRDEAGNVGISAPLSFATPPTAALPAPTPTPPKAAFEWFPARPRAGERISLVSVSTDVFSPLAAYAWDVAPGGAFQPGAAVRTVRFKHSGFHVVYLRVTAADGLTSTLGRSIHVFAAPATIMQPFPVVRIAGVLTNSGVNVTTLTASTPLGARVTVSCHGAGCPSGSDSRTASLGKGKAREAVELLTFSRFQRRLLAGAVLEVRVYERGRIGKYTRFVIRGHRLPARLDTCLGPAGIKPVACPGS